jgi:hypothetical protein
VSFVQRPAASCGQLARAIARKRAPTGAHLGGYTSGVDAAVRRGLRDKTTGWMDSRPNVPRKILTNETVDTRQTGDVRSTA